MEGSTCVDDMEGGSGNILCCACWCETFDKDDGAAKCATPSSSSSADEDGNRFPSSLDVPDVTVCAYSFKAY